MKRKSVKDGRFYGTPYHELLYTPATFKAMVDGSLRKLHQIQKLPGHRFNVLAGTGHSGLIMGSVLAEKFGVPFITIRKDGDGSHDHRPNPNKVSGYLPAGARSWRYLIIDDLIEYGSTIKTIVSKMNAFHKYEGEKYTKSSFMLKPKCVGVLLYRCGYQDDSSENEIETEDGVTRIFYRKKTYP